MGVAGGGVRLADERVGVARGGVGLADERVVVACVELVSG